jgi:hypothetical protein
MTLSAAGVDFVPTGQASSCPLGVPPGQGDRQPSVESSVGLSKLVRRLSVAVGMAPASLLEYPGLYIFYWDVSYDHRPPALNNTQARKELPVERWQKQEESWAKYMASRQGFVSEGWQTVDAASFVFPPDVSQRLRKRPPSPSSSGELHPNLHPGPVTT